MFARALLLAALLSLACNGESPTAPGPPTAPFTRAVFLGRTVDPAGAPVANVELRLIQGDRQTATVTSAPDGSFRLEDLTPGNYGLLLRVNGGAEQSRGMISLTGGLNPHDVLVSSCILPYGTVRDASTGRPLAGAKVTIFFRETTTDAEGHYRLDFGCTPVQGSTITMKAKHPDYHPQETLTRASGLCTCAYDFLLTRR